MCAEVLYQLLNTVPPATVEIWREPKSDPLHVAVRLCTGYRGYPLELGSSMALTTCLTVKL